MKTILILCALVLTSCLHKNLSCEAFDFSRVPYDQSYYSKSLSYSNGFDTIEVLLKNKNYSKSSTWGFADMDDCNPSFELRYYDSSHLIDILYSFDYFDNGRDDNSTNLSMHINSCNLSFNFDTIVQKIGQEMIFDEIGQGHGGDGNWRIEKVTFQKMRITSIETHSGIKWQLIKIGDSLLPVKPFKVEGYPPSYIK